MEKNSGIYTLEEIEKFLQDYRETQGKKPKNWMVAIPGIGRKMYQKAALEEQKRLVFEEALNRAKQGTAEEKLAFIEKMTPVLDDFYSNKEAEKVNGRNFNK